MSTTLLSAAAPLSPFSDLVLGEVAALTPEAADGRLRVAIVGSRNYCALWEVGRLVRALRALDPVVVSGGARGVDQVAALAAAMNGLLCEIFPARWAALGKSAGMRRNQDIVDRSDAVVAFWDGSSRGTADTVDRATRVGKPCFVREMRIPPENTEGA